MGATTDITATIQALEAKRYAAMLAGDTEGLGTLFSDDMVYMHSSGVQDDRAAYLQKFAAGVFQYHEINVSDVTIRAYGDTALVFGHLTASITGDGTPRQLDNFYLVVWARQGGQWRCVAYQPTPVPK